MEWVRLGKLVDIKTGKLNANAAVPNGKYPFFTTAQEISYIDSYSYDDEVVLVAGNGDLNVKYYKGKFDAYQRTYILTKKENAELNLKFLYFFMTDYVKILRSQSIGGVIKYIKLENLTEAKIPLLSFVQQTNIVDMLNKTEALIKNRKEQIQAYDDLIESLFFEMFNHLEVKETSLKKHIKFSKNSVSDFSDYLDENYIGVENIEKETGRILKVEKVSDSNIKSSKNYFTRDDVLYSRIRPNLNKVALPDFDGLVSSEVFVINCGSEINKFFLTYTLRSKKFVTYAMLNSSGANFPRVNKKIIEGYKIKVPPIELQNKFAEYVIKIEEEKKKLNSSLKELEDLFDALMQDAFSGNLFKD